MRWLDRLRAWLSARFAPASQPLAAPDIGTTRPATWTDVETVAALLEKHGVDYVLVGGYALYANGLIRATGDVDILVANDPANNRRWITALSELPDGAAKTIAEGERDDPFPHAEEGGDDGEPGVIRVNDVFTIDIMPRACGLTIDDLRAHVARISDRDLSINVLTMEGLALTKRGVRDKDRADLRQLEMAIAARRRGSTTPSP
jgi:hypothetical protein